MELSTAQETPRPTAEGFRLETRMLDLRFRFATLVAREWVNPDYVRVRVQGDELVGFDSPGADDHMRLFFPEHPVETIDDLRAAPSREYTPLTWGEDWLDIEFAVHGDEGIAARWAADASLGSTIGVGGPRGSKILEGRPDAWFLAGDETAIPAIRRWAEFMSSDASGRILIEVADADHEIAITAPAGVDVEYVHRDGRPAASALIARIDAITADERPTGAVFGFVAAEHTIVKPARALLRDRWELPAEHISVRGYWKRGETEYHAPH